jgi:hypothetical protein
MHRHGRVAQSSRFYFYFILNEALPAGPKQHAIFTFNCHSIKNPRPGRAHQSTYFYF